MDTKNLEWNLVKLTPFGEDDAAQLFQWQNDPDIRDLTKGFRFPVQMDNVKEWLKSIRDQNSKSRTIFAIRVANKFAGTVQLNSIDPYQRKAMFGIMIGDPEQRGKGVGYMATSLMLDYAFNGLDFRRVGLEVIEPNPAKHLYERLGFKIEGKIREDYYSDGKSIDTLLYGILRSEFVIDIPKNANRLLKSF
jgi:RimJ/RimL family protein N-acetyltransferase